MSAARKSTYVYVHDAAGNGRVFGFALDRQGALTALPGSPFVTDEIASECAGQCQTMAYSRKRKVLLTTSDSGVTAWRVAGDGALTEVEGSPFPAPGAIGVAVVEIRGRAFAFTARNPDALTGFEIQKDGTLTPHRGTPFTVGSDLVGATAVGSTLLVMDEDGGVVHSYRVGRSGSLTEPDESPIDLTRGDEAYSIHTAANGKFVVAGGRDTLSVGRLDRKTGTIAPLPGPAFEPALSAHNGPAVSSKSLVAVIPFGLPTSADDVQILRLDRKTGALESLGGLQTLGMSRVSTYGWDLQGRHLVCASREGDEVRTFAVDRKTGAVAQVAQAVIPGANNVTDIEVLRR